MVDVVLSSDNVTVLGGPSRLDVDLNIGAPGNRGSLFFIDDRNPNTLIPNQDFPTIPEIFDIFINVDPSSTKYLTAYQYVNQDGQNVWVEAFSLNQEPLSINRGVTFSSGVAELQINLAELGLEKIPFSELQNSFAYFNVQATISNKNLETKTFSTNPISMGIDVKDVISQNPNTFDPSRFPSSLPITLVAFEFDGSAWIPLNNKTVPVYLNVSFANPNQIFEFLSPEEGDE
jgi:hypothetical protein